MAKSSGSIERHTTSSLEEGALDGGEDLPFVRLDDATPDSVEECDQCVDGFLGFVHRGRGVWGGSHGRVNYPISSVIDPIAVHYLLLNGMVVFVNVIVYLGSGHLLAGKRGLVWRSFVHHGGGITCSRMMHLVVCWLRPVILGCHLLIVSWRLRFGRPSRDKLVVW